MRLLCRRQFPRTFCVRSRQSIEQLHEARLVRITNGRLAIWLHPFGMLEPEVVVNLSPKLGVGMDLVKHGYWLREKIPGCRGSVAPTPRRNVRQEMASRPRANSQVSAPEKARRPFLRCARR